MKTTENLKAVYSAVNSLGAVAENQNITHVVAVRLREQYEAAGLALNAIESEHAALVAVAEAADRLVKWLNDGGATKSVWPHGQEQHDIRAALAALAAVRTGSEVVK